MTHRMETILSKITDSQIEFFQQSLNEETIEDIWKAFTETSRSFDGKINKTTMMRVFTTKLANSQKSSKLMIQNDLIIEALFERFKMDKTNEIPEKDQKLDLQDLVISLAILARISNREKLMLTFKLMDVDEDGCLQISDIYQLFNKIEKNFSKESSDIDFQSSSLFQENASKKAYDIYNWVVKQLQKKINSEDKEKQQADKIPFEQTLITQQEFSDLIKDSMDIFDKVLPYNYQLKYVFQNVLYEKVFRISNQNLNEFENFRKEIHNYIRSQFKSDFYRFQLKQESNKNTLVVRLPGQIDTKNIPRTQKVNNTLRVNPNDKNAQVGLPKLNIKKTRYAQLLGLNNEDQLHSRFPNLFNDGTNNGESSNTEIYDKEKLRKDLEVHRNDNNQNVERRLQEMKAFSKKSEFNQDGEVKKTKVLSKQKY